MFWLPEGQPDKIGHTMGNIRQDGDCGIAIRDVQKIFKHIPSAVPVQYNHWNSTSLRANQQSSAPLRSFSPMAMPKNWWFEHINLSERFDVRTFFWFPSNGMGWFHQQCSCLTPRLFCLPEMLMFFRDLMILYMVWNDTRHSPLVTVEPTY